MTMTETRVRALLVCENTLTFRKINEAFVVRGWPTTDLRQTVSALVRSKVIQESRDIEYSLTETVD